MNDELTPAQKKEAERYASLSAKRFEDESFSDYKLRMRNTKKILKAYLRKSNI